MAKEIYLAPAALEAAAPATVASAATPAAAATAGSGKIEWWLGYLLPWLV